MQSNPVYLFKQAASFGEGLSYSKGVHRVPEKVLRHPYFQKLVDAGHVVDASKGAAGGADQPVKPVDAQKRAVEASQAEAKRKLAEMKKQDEEAAAAKDESEDDEAPKGKSKKK